MATVVWTMRAKTMRKKLYRNDINKRFKIIYRYDEENDIVVIEDIWDTRRSPENLTKRVKINNERARRGRALRRKRRKERNKNNNNN